MVLVKSVELDIGVKGDADAKAKLDDISARAEALKKAFPTYALKVDAAAASAKLKVFRAELDDATKDRTEKIKVKVDDSALQKLQKSSFLKPSVLGSALALSPALIPLLGATAGAVGAIGISFGAAAAGAGLFGLAAESVLSSTATNLAKLQALELTLNKATTPAAKKTAQAAIDALKATWSAGYLTMIDDYQTFQQKWTSVSQAIAVPALTAWLPAVTKGLSFLIPAVTPVANLFKSWGTTLDRYFSNPAVAARINSMAAAFGKFSAAQLSDVARFVGDIAQGIFNLGRDLGSSGANLNRAGTWLAGIGAGFLTWSSSAKARGDVQGFLAYLHQEGPVVTGILSDLGKILPGIFQGASATGTLELQAIASFLGLIARLPTGWQMPLTEAAGVLLLLAKTGVVSVGIKLVGLGGAGGAAGAAGAAGMWAKLLPGVRLVGAALAISLVIDEVLQNPKNPAVLGNTNPKSWFNNWDTAFKGSIIGEIMSGAIPRGWDSAIGGMRLAWGGLATAMASLWNTAWNNTVTRTAKGFHDIAGWFDTGRHDISHIWDVLMSDIALSWDVTKNKIGITWDDIELIALHGVQYILNIMGKLPGPLGAPFRTAARDIGNSMTGIQADVARRTAQIQADINRIHGKTVNVGVTASGAGHITITGTGTASGSGGIRLNSMAAGGRVTGGTPGRDSVLINAMPGEVVVPTHMVRGGAVDHLRGKLPGFAAGGLVGLGNSIGRLQPYVSGQEESDTAKAIAAGIRKAIAAAKASMGSGPAIASYAMSFLGKIPYVWGGTSLNSFGADCSGFTQAVYSHFGIGAPRTSEAQGGWVKRGPAVPGGLAFYHSPAGGADPGHVAIVRDASQVISQGGGMGPTLMGIHGMPLLWTGVPPGGLPSGGGGGGVSAGRMSAASIAALWRSLGGRASAANNMAAIANAESSDIPSARQTGEPPGLTGWGLYQITPTSGINQNGVFGNLLNASNNTRAAISLYNASGYQPWASDPVASRLIASGLSYDRGGVLRPGLTLAYNGTGRPEQVIPGGGSGAAVHLHLTVNGPVGSQSQLEDWFVHTANKTSRTGRLTQAVRAASRG